VGFESVGDAVAWLDAHVDYESTTIRSAPTLDRMVELVAVLGNPERTYPSLHITGTNGKGSTAAMATALLGAAGLAVGTYTSPNLARVNERLAYGGEPIADDAFADVLRHLALVEPLLSERPTRFELLTAAALWWFGDLAVDAAVVEVGLGGTWDCTNVVDGTVAVLTNVSYDHTEVLGPTLEGIATDKAGIVKPGSTVVIGESDPGLVDLIGGIAARAGADGVWVRGTDFDCSENRTAVGGRLVDLRTPTSVYRDVFVPLHGRHQGENAACALAAVEAFLGRPLGEDVIGEAFDGLVVPGRIEVLARHPLCVVDGAHNVAGTRALAAAVAEELAVDGPKIAVVGMLGGRDPLAMLAPLRDVGIGVVVACAPRSPRALAAEVVAEAARSLGLDAVVADSVPAAVAVARTHTPDDGLVLVTGSLYVVADARACLLTASC
jgi:dihydrofolate synthase/folylpolyglutamate synthase